MPDFAAQQTSDFAPRENVFPQDRPNVMPTQDAAMQMPANKIAGLGVDQLIDMEVVGMVMGRYELSKTWRRTKRLIWDKCWQNMKGIYDKTGKAAWQSTTFMPLTSKVVEVISANIFGALAGPEMPVEWQTRRSDFDQQVRAINELIGVDLDKTKFKVEMGDFVRTNVLLGTAIGECGYSKETETVMVKQRQKPSPMDEMLRQMGIPTGEQFVPKQMLVKDHATIKNKDIYDIYPEPRVPEFSKDHWVIEKCKITNRELRMGSMDADPFYRLDNVTDDLLEGSGMQRVDQDPELQTRRFALNDYNAYTHFLDPDREHELYKYYGQVPVWYLPGNSEMRRDRKRQYDSVPGVIWVVDGQYVVWNRISPWRDGEPPFFKGNYIRLPNEFYGIGVAEIVMGLQTEKNEIRNSRMDNINLSMNKIIAVLKDLVPPTEWNRLKSEPGAIWLFKGVDDVRKAMQQIEFGNVTEDSWMASKEVDQEAQEATAAVKATMGVQGNDSDAGGNTFRGQMLNAQMATERWMLYARTAEVAALVPAFKKFYQRIYQFKTYQDAIDTLGPARAQMFEFPSPEDLEKMAKLVPLGVMTMETKGVKLAQMAQFQTQWLGQPWFKALEFARKEWVEMGNPEPDAVLFSDQEIQQFNQMRQMMFQEQSQMPGPMPGGAKGGAGGPPQGPKQTGQAGNAPGGQPVSGNVPGPSHGQPRPAMPARGPGAAPIDLHGMPMS